MAGPESALPGWGPGTQNRHARRPGRGFPPPPAARSVRLARFPPPTRPVPGRLSPPALPTWPDPDRSGGRPGVAARPSFVSRLGEAEEQAIIMKRAIIIAGIGAVAAATQSKWLAIAFLITLMGNFVFAIFEMRE